MFFPEHHPGKLANIFIGTVDSGKFSCVLGKAVFPVLVTASQPHGKVIDLMNKSVIKNNGDLLLFQ